MVTENPALENILQALSQLFQQLEHAHKPQTRLELLKQMRMLLADADKIIGSEMGEGWEKATEEVSGSLFLRWRNPRYFFGRQCG
jgi:hypothetical protein